jgi:rhodanese-related sulfurtransferase
MRAALALALPLVVVACASAPPAQPPAVPAPAVAAAAEPDADLRKMHVDEVAARVEKKDPRTFVYDANKPERYAKGHVPGAKWVDSMNLAADTLPADKTSDVVFYCWNEQCSASHAAARAATKLGYANAYVMPEGIVGWESKGKPTEK